MANKITRRNFIQKSATIGASSIIGMPLLQGTVFASNTQRKAVDISVVQGENYFNNTVNAVEQLGGMKKFVSRGSQVGLLINCPHSNPGCHVKPEIVLAVVKMCYDAGAKEIACIKSPSQRYWSRSPMSEKFAEEIKSLKLSQGDFVKYEIKQGLKLKEANIARELLECDIFINIPINKNHEGTRFTGNLKNMMGACPYSTNSFFHNGSNAAGPYEDVEFLSQCIVDLNHVRKPDLCFTDATEFITTNGPFGPGEIVRPKKVVAGANRVSVDSYCSTLLGLSGEDVIMIKKAHEIGFGEMDLSKLHISKLTI